MLYGCSNPAVAAIFVGWWSRLRRLWWHPRLRHNVGHIAQQKWTKRTWSDGLILGKALMLPSVILNVQDSEWKTENSSHDDGSYQNYGHLSRRLHVRLDRSADSAILRLIVPGTRTLGAYSCDALGKERASGGRPTLINKVHNAKSQREAKACSQDNVHGDFSIWFENCDPVALEEKAEDARKDD